MSVNRVTVNARAFAACALVQAGPKEVRQYLAGVYAEPNPQGKGVILVGTDGARLLAVLDLNGTIEGDPQIWRAPKNVLSEAGKKAKEVRQVELVSQVINEDIVERAEVTAGIVAIVTSPCEVVCGKYPDWRNVVPTVVNFRGDGAQRTSAFQPDFIADLGRIAKLLSDSKMPITQITFNNDNRRPAVVEFEACLEGVSAFMVLMPTRPAYVGDEISIPDWVRG